MIIKYFLLVFLFTTNYLYPHPNPDFDSTLTGWTSTGNAFDSQPVHGDKIPTIRIRPVMCDSIGGDYWREIPHPIGHHGLYWVSSSGVHTSDTNSSEGDSLTGTLSSDEFTIQNSKIYFLIGGTGGRIELLIKNGIDFDIVESISPNGIEILTRKYFDTKNLIDSQAMIRIVDDRTDAHINVDDFLIEKSIFFDNDTMNYKFRTNFTNKISDYHNLCYIKNHDVNLPVWGFIDTHGHWMNNVGFGGEFVFGRPYGRIDTALKVCDSIHGIGGLGNLFFGKKDLTLSAFPSGDEELLGHNTSGYPLFSGWPNFRTTIHQLMYIDWVRRAYMGGLRLIVCPIGNNENVARTFGQEYGKFDEYSDYSDSTVTKRGVEYLRKMVCDLKSEGWLAIAENSDSAKRLIMENKLVVIISIEQDCPGNFKDLKIDTNFIAEKNYMLIEFKKSIGINSGKIYNERYETDRVNKFKEILDSNYRKIINEDCEQIITGEFLFKLKEDFKKNLDLEFGNGSNFNSSGELAQKFIDNLQTFFFKDVKNNYRKIDVFLGNIESLGVRHMFPIHHADNAFGGYSLYGSEHFAVNSHNFKGEFYDLNDTLRYVEIDSSSQTQFRLGDEKDDFQEVMLEAISSYKPPLDYHNLYKGKGHINRRGLSLYGKYLVKGLMRRGIIIDLDHLSFKSTDDVMKLTRERNYPSIAGHTNFIEQQFNRLDMSQCMMGLFNMKNEHAKRESLISELQKTGGLVCPTTDGDKDVITFSDVTNFVLNDNPGSSKTFAQCYLYAINKMHNKGVGIGTDMNGLLTQLCPRFGTFSSYALRENLRRQQVIGTRNFLAYKQENGVRYDVPLMDCESFKFISNDGAFSDEEEEIFQAIYAAHSCQKIFVTEKQQKMMNGFYNADVLPPVTINYSKAYGYDELELAAYLVALEFERKIKIDLRKISWFDNETGAYKLIYDYPELNAHLIEDYIRKIYPLYESYMKTFGNNIPLKRYKIQINKNNVVDYDFNIDGLAHYGLLPDFIQDLKNVGLTTEQLTPLFNSAKDFTDIMKKCEYISKSK